MERRRGASLRSSPERTIAAPEYTISGASGLVGWPWTSAFAEPPPETTRIRIGKVASVCLAPQYVAGELLHGEGFVDVQYIGDGDLGSGGVPGHGLSGKDTRISA